MVERADWLILLLGFKGEAENPELDPIRIQKGMFLLAHEAGLPNGERYDFSPHL